MRIIGGDARGRTIVAPEGNTTRPTADKTRESLFNILMRRVPDARVLDLFGGTGALALEAMSRGASSAVICDNNAKAIAAITRNTETVMKGKSGVTVIRADYRQALECLRGKEFDLIFLDPPYGSGMLEKAMDMIREIDNVSENGIIICENGSSAGWPSVSAPYRLHREYRYGKIKTALYRRNAEVRQEC